MPSGPIAMGGHEPMHTPHEVHSYVFTSATWPGRFSRGTIAIASYGQSCTHCSHPVHVRSFTAAGAGSAVTRGLVNHGTTLASNAMAAMTSSTVPAGSVRVSGSQKP